MTIENATVKDAVVTDNRDATRKDAVALSRLYHVLMKSAKATKKAVTAVSEGWLPGRDIALLREERDAAVKKHDQLMDTAWAGLKKLPNGTVAPGGATPQTVGLEFFNRSLNRTLGERLSAKAAKDANRRSFS